MPLFVHIHDAPGISAEEVFQGHLRDIAIGQKQGVNYRRYWVDVEAGKFFCLVEATDASAAEAVHAETHGMLPAETYEVREGLRDRRDFESMLVLFAGALERDSNCIDVGCSLGVILREIVRRAPDGNHIAYEPIPALSAAIATRYPQVDVREAVLSDQPGERTFVHLTDRPGYSHLLRNGEQVTEPSELITVSMEVLDRALPPDYVPALIKVDVEGAELSVLRGAEKTLARHKPIVIFEHGPGRPDVTEELFELLSTRCGLRLYDIDGDGPLGFQRFLDVVGEGRIWNFVARA